MKKKIVTLLLVAAMTGTMVVGCGSKADDKTSDTKTEQTDDKKDTEEKKELADDEYQYVSAADTVIADGVHVLDVREWENYSKGRVANSEWCPIFISFNSGSAGFLSSTDCSNMCIAAIGILI